MVNHSPCLTISIIRLGSRVKWINPGNCVAPSPTPRCSSYWKEGLRVTLNEGRQLYLLLISFVVYSGNNFAQFFFDEVTLKSSKWLSMVLYYVKAFVCRIWYKVSNSAAMLDSLSWLLNRLWLQVVILWYTATKGILVSHHFSIRKLAQSRGF